MKAPRLSKLDLIAWRIFSGCSTRWNTDFGQRTGLMYDQAKLVAELNGYEFNGPLFSRVRRLELLTLTDDAKVAKARSDKAEARDRNARPQHDVN